jgi:hypothetical protein
MTCPRCGRVNAEDAHWCVTCGSALGGESGGVERVRVEIAPPRIAVTPGAAASARVRVRSLGDLVGRFVLRLGGPAAPYAVLEPQTVRLMPGGEAVVVLHVAVPRGPEPAAGALGLFVDVYAGDAAKLLAQGDADVDVQPFADLTARVVPSTGQAWRRRRYRLEVQNRGNADADLRMSGTDPDEALTVRPTPDRLTVRPAERGEALVEVRAARLKPLGRPAQRPFTVAVETEGGHRLERDARLVQRALVTRTVVTLVVLVAALLIAAVAALAAAP